jgi:hypothetical protein
MNATPVPVRRLQLGGALAVVAGTIGLLVVAGCKSVEFGSYTTPEIHGRVVAADTGRPLAGVLVTRPTPRSPTGAAQPATSIALLSQERPVLTDARGKFVFPSRSYLLTFHGAGGWDLPLSFQASHYAVYQTNLTLTHFVENLPAGTPVVELGDFRLKPLAP